MEHRVDEVEARILGSLIEKSLTTPELYPLTLNALVNACNQKNSREPVMSLDHAAVEAGVKSLVAKGFVAQRYEPGGRAAKFGHRVEVLLNSENPKIVGLVCVLLLRGPQTVGELKSRTERLCVFESVAEVEALLSELAGRSEVEKLPRQPGQKESRFRQLYSAPAPEHAAAAAPQADPQAAPPAAADRIGELERRIRALEERLAKLEAPKPS